MNENQNSPEGKVVVGSIQKTQVKAGKSNIFHKMKEMKNFQEEHAWETSRATKTRK